MEQYNDAPAEYGESRPRRLRYTRPLSAVLVAGGLAMTTLGLAPLATQPPRPQPTYIGPPVGPSGANQYPAPVAPGFGATNPPNTATPTYVEAASWADVLIGASLIAVGMLVLASGEVVADRRGQGRPDDDTIEFD